MAIVTLAEVFLDLALDRRREFALQIPANKMDCIPTAHDAIPLAWTLAQPALADKSAFGGPKDWSKGHSPKDHKVK